MERDSAYFCLPLETETEISLGWAMKRRGRCPKGNYENDVKVVRARSYRIIG